MSREAPEPWASWMRHAGFVDPNTKTVRASMRQLAKEAKVHTTTVAAVMFGDRAPKHATITAVAEALGVDVRTVAEQAGQTRTEREPYAMPDEVHLLSGRVQVAITQLIRAIAEERGHGGLNTAATSGAGGTPAQVAVDAARSAQVQPIGTADEVPEIPDAGASQHGGRRRTGTRRGEHTGGSTTP